MDRKKIDHAHDDTSPGWAGKPRGAGRVIADRQAPRGLDATVAHSARIYDWWLGGKDNFAADRELGQKIVDLVPMTPGSARANRAFLHRAAEAVAREGVHQFLDLGAGL